MVLDLKHPWPDFSFFQPLSPPPPNLRGWRWLSWGVLLLWLLLLLTLCIKQGPCLDYLCLLAQWMEVNICDDTRVHRSDTLKATRFRSTQVMPAMLGIQMFGWIIKKTPLISYTVYGVILSSTDKTDLNCWKYTKMYVSHLCWKKCWSIKIVQTNVVQEFQCLSVKCLLEMPL